MLVLVAGFVCLQVNAEIVVPEKIDLGLLRGDINTVKVTIVIENVDATNVFEIQSVKGSCSCYKGFAGASKVKPKSTSEIILTFDLSNFKNELSWKSKVAIQGVIDNKPLLNVIDFSAKFDAASNLRAFLLPTNIVSVNSLDRTEGRAEPVLFKLYCPTSVAGNVSVQVEPVSNIISENISIDKNHPVRFGSFTEIGLIKIQSSDNSKRPSRHIYRIPINLSGAINTTIFAEFDLISIL